MHTIYKYALRVTDLQRIEMPAGATVLSVQDQGGVMCVWAYVNPASQLTETRTFYVVGTGNPIDEGWLRDTQFVGTVQMGRFVWHVFVSRNRG